MNKTNLQIIFKKYIDNFEMLNNEENNETYKWEIAQKFQEFDVDAEDFAEMLNHMCKISNNLIDSSQQLPFYALVDYAYKEPETVREMFRKLFADENLDPEAKQQTIIEFIEASEELRKKYYPNSRLYVNNLRSVMMYLFLRYPDSNFGYKANQAKSFADCIEFYDDWGSMNDFKPDIFNHMCEQLIDEIRANDALMKTHMSRFKNTDRSLYPDKNLHILVDDIIYCSQVYDFYIDMTFEPINAQSRKLHIERVAKAKELAEAAKEAKQAADKLREAKEYINIAFTKGTVVKHRTLGEGTIEACKGTILTIFFPKINQVKELDFTVTIDRNLMSLASDEATAKIKQYIPILAKEKNITKNYARTTEMLEPYLKYLDSN